MGKMREWGFKAIKYADNIASGFLSKQRKRSYSETDRAFQSSSNGVEGASRSLPLDPVPVESDHTIVLILGGSQVRATDDYREHLHEYVVEANYFRVMEPRVWEAYRERSPLKAVVESRDIEADHLVLMAFEVYMESASSRMHLASIVRRKRREDALPSPDKIEQYVVTHLDELDVSVFDK